MDNKIHMTVSPSMVKALTMLKNKSVNQYDLALLVSLIETKGEIKIGVIAEMLGVEYQTINRAMNSLRDKGLVEYQAHGYYSVVDAKQEEQKVAVLAEIRAAKELMREAQEKLAKLKTS